MRLFPSYSRFCSLQQQGYSRIPLCREMLSDFITPLQALQAMQNLFPHVFLFESALPDEKNGRYTFLCFDPAARICSQAGSLSITKLRGDTPFIPSLCESSLPAAIDALLGCLENAPVDGLPPFSGGLAGYLGFEAFGLSEPVTGLLKSEGLPEADLYVIDRLLCFDHYRKTLSLIVLADASGPDGYCKALEELDFIQSILRNRHPAADHPLPAVPELQPRFDRKAFTEMVTRAKGSIARGDIFQVVLSNCLQAEYPHSLLPFYRHLRSLNPSPYMFYLQMPDLEIAGASPETLVSMNQGLLKTYPLAGTRKRGADPAEDEALEKELLADAKELAEHDMLVDLGRNDLGRICRFGSVKVSNLHSVLRYSHVMHIGSTVEGTLDDVHYGAADALLSVLPAGTLSGAPKIRACQIIRDLEGNSRGVYGGAIGYFDRCGGMDFCIGIRLAVRSGTTLSLQSGAGITIHSDPDKEYEECLNKAAAMKEALVRAGREYA